MGVNNIGAVKAIEISAALLKQSPTLKYLYKVKIWEVKVCGKGFKDQSFSTAIAKACEYMLKIQSIDSATLNH